jgi:hypothetical protein
MIDLLQKSVLKSGKRDEVETRVTYKKVKKLKAEDFKRTRAGAFRNIQPIGGNS